MENRQGFVQILTLACLPFFLAGFLLLFATAGLIQLHTRVNSDCRREQISAQAKVRTSLEALLKKNTQARRLKLEYDKTKIELEIAIAAESLAVAELAAKLERIQFEREVLDLSQKQLILAANAVLSESALKTYRQVQQEGSQQIKTAQGILDGSLRASSPKIHPLPVEPEYPDIAPPYRTMEDFPRLEALEQKWHYQIRVRAPLDRFLPGQADFEKQCSTTLEPEDDTWTVTTKEDKSSSKRSSSY